MIKLFDPTPILVEVAVVVAVVTGTYFYAHHKGYTEHADELRVEVAKRNEQERIKEEQHIEAIGALATQLAKEKQNAKAANDQYRAALRAGTERMYVNVRPVQAGGDSTSVTGDRNQTRAELDPATAEELVGIANDGDDAIRQLNACIDAYNAIRGK